MADPMASPIPQDDLAFSDLVQRELRSKAHPQEVAALGHADTDLLGRWVAALQRFEADVALQLADRKTNMERLLQEEDRAAWTKARPGYYKWRRGATRFRKHVQQRLREVRLRLRRLKPRVVKDPLRQLLRSGLDLATDDPESLVAWQARVRRTLQRSEQRGALPGEHEIIQGAPPDGGDDGAVKRLERHGGSG